MVVTQTKKLVVAGKRISKFNQKKETAINMGELVGGPSEINGPLKDCTLELWSSKN